MGDGEIMLIDITDMLLPSLDERSANATVAAVKVEMARSRHPQAGLMFAKLAADHSDNLGTAEDEFDDFSNAMNFRALATCLQEFVDPEIEPSFEEPLRPDPAVQHVFALQLMNETNLHQAACMRAGLRRAWYDVEQDYGELRLTKRRRCSALTLVDAPAQADLLRITKGLNDGQTELSEDAVYFAFASAREHLKFVCEADPRAWTSFEKATGVSTELLTSFSGFLVFLDFAAREFGHSLAYTEEKLKTLADIYKLAFPDAVVDADNVMTLVDQFSLTAARSCDLLLPVPFFRFGRQYLRYVGFEKIMAPAMGLLTILIRMHDNAWNNSVGGTLARAADVLAETLPSFGRLKVAVRRTLKGGGDVDLALYDVESRHLLLCEVKTVYDKHRTVLHLHRFEEAKVNVARAVGQLHDAAAAVTSGAVDTHALFQRKLPPPLRVSTGLLTWFDPVDVTVGTPYENVLSLNFATLRYLLDRAEGDVGLLCRTARELRNIWCASELRRIDLQTDFPTRIEVQIPVLDSAADLEGLGLTSLTRAVLEHLPALPDTWRTSHSESSVVSYLTDTIATLADQST
jgi:hypothetical protein